MSKERKDNLEGNGENAPKSVMLPISQPELFGLPVWEDLNQYIAFTKSDFFINAKKSEAEESMIDYVKRTRPLAPK